MARWPPPKYRIEMDLDVPVSYAFRWCTDYQPDDAHRSREDYQRKVLSRTRNRVVFEDLWWSGKGGWGWRHSEVLLQPPDRWHATSYGSFRDAEIDYRLHRRGDNRARLELTLRRRPHPAHPTQPSRTELETELREMWTHYRRSMAEDFRRETSRSTQRGRRRK